MMGTPAFMAPEQVMGKTSEIDGQTDVWAVGATMFTLLSGRLVHEADTVQEMMIRAATTPAPLMASVVADAPPVLCAVLDRSLRFAKDERWPSAAAMRDALIEASATLCGPAGLERSLAEQGEVAATLLAQPRHGSQGPTAAVAGRTVSPVAALPSAPATLGGSSHRHGPELVTAQPVSRTWAPGAVLEGANTRWMVILGSLGSVILAAALAIAVSWLRPTKATTTASPPGSATGAVGSPNGVGDRSDPSLPPEAIAASSVRPSASPAIAPKVGPVAASTGGGAPLLLQPVATSHPSTAPLSTSPPTATMNAVPGPAGKPGCNPPYEMVNGIKRWKRNCLSQ